MRRDAEAEGLTTVLRELQLLRVVIVKRGDAPGRVRLDESADARAGEADGRDDRDRLARAT